MGPPNVSLQTVEANHETKIDIPVGGVWRLTSATVPLDARNLSAGPIQLMAAVEPKADERIAICVLGHAEGAQNVPCNWTSSIAFDSTSSPVRLSLQNDQGVIHVVGQWEADPNYEWAALAGTDDEASVESGAEGDAEEARPDGAVATGTIPERKRDRGKASPEEGSKTEVQSEVQSERDAKRAAKKARREARAAQRVALAKAFAEAERVDRRARQEEEDRDGVGITVKKPKERVMRGGLSVTDTVIGNGNPVRKGKQVRLLYEGYLTDMDGKMFDSNWNRGRPFKFRVGQREVIEGLDRGVMGMKVGGQRIIKVPHMLGYGPKGTPDGVIPGGATLCFKLELVGAQQ